VGVLLALFAASSACSNAGRSQSLQDEVIVYCAQDQLFAEPIFSEFTQATRIRVKAKWDVEAAKTTGLVNALQAERRNPRCDVFWNNEIGQTIMLERAGLLQPYLSENRRGIPPRFLHKDGLWTGIGARARIILYNRDLVGAHEVPRSIYDLLHPRWAGRITIARPIFGTTLTHAVALFRVLGESKAKAFFEGLLRNKAVLAEGNAHVKDLVASGQMAFGLTDTDDANIAIRAAKPVSIAFPDQEGMGTLMIPNTVMIVKGCPHPAAARKLVDFLISKQNEERLARGPSAQLPLHQGSILPPDLPELGKVRQMRVEYEELGNVQSVMTYLGDLFLR